jgi:hypothetical protein
MVGLNAGEFNGGTVVDCLFRSPSGRASNPTESSHRDTKIPEPQMCL